jgi:hypothetical protein
MESKKDRTAILLLIFQGLLNFAYDTSFWIAFSKPGKKKRIAMGVASQQ